MKDTYPNTVSIITPAYNSEKFIEATIRSVQSQTFTDWKLIVVDDCSEDSTPSIVQKLQTEDPRIELLLNPENLGVANARNRGVEYASSEYIAFLDSDDIWLPEKLELQLKKLKESGADLAYSSYSIINEDGEKVGSDYDVPENVTYEMLLKENVIGCSTVILKSDVAKKHPFSADQYHEDYVLWLSLLREGHRFVGCTDALVKWRYLKNSRSYNKKTAALHRWRIYRDYLKLPLVKSVLLFLRYCLSGLMKYFKVSK